MAFDQLNFGWKVSSLLWNSRAKFFSTISKIAKKVGNTYLLSKRAFLRRVQEIESTCAQCDLNTSDHNLILFVWCIFERCGNFPSLQTHLIY